MTVMWSHMTVATVMTVLEVTSHTGDTQVTQKCDERQLLADTWLSNNRHYAIPHVTKHETDRWQKSGYYATFLSGEEDRGLWNVSTQEHFVSSLHHWCMQVSLITSMSISLVETLCIVGRNIKSLPPLVRKELANCSAILALHWPLKMAA